jgi:hypothetical protein
MPNASSSEPLKVQLLKLHKNIKWGKEADEKDNMDRKSPAYYQKFSPRPNNAERSIESTNNKVREFSMKDGIAKQIMDFHKNR